MGVVSASNPGASIVLGTRQRVAHESGKFRHQGREAMHRHAVVEPAAPNLDHRCRRTLHRRDRITRDLGRWFGVGKHQLAPGFVHVPFDIIGKQAQEKVCAQPIRSAKAA